MGSLDAKSSYANNGQKFIESYGAGNRILEDMTIQKLDVPYRIYDPILPTAALTINPGVTMEFTTDAGIFLSSSFKNAAIIANGTATDPIKFVGYIGQVKGVWAGLSTQNGNPITKFNYCIVDGAGSTTDPFFCIPKTSKAAIYLGRELDCTPVSGKGTITNCTISNSGGYGIAYRDGDAVTTKDNTFKDNTKADIYLFK